MECPDMLDIMLETAQTSLRLLGSELFLQLSRTGIRESKDYE